MRVGVIGLGAMGLGMARTLVAKGFAVSGFDLSEARRGLAADAGVMTGATLNDVIAQSDVLVASLPTAADVAGVVEGEMGFLALAPKGAVFIDTSTSEASTSRRLAASCAERGLGFLDAPVSGGPAGANAGTLTFMIGGDPDQLSKARPVIDAMAGKVLHVGPSGAGNVAKLVNNLLVAAHLLTVSEAVRLSEAAGVPAADVLAVINAASGRSAVSEVNYPRWILSGGFDSGFTMGLMRKDVRLAAQLGAEAGTFGPVSKLVADIWAASTATFPDQDDFNAITKRDL